MTEEAEKAKSGDMLQQHYALQARLSKLEHELKSIGRTWKQMAALFEDCHSSTFAIDEVKIRVSRPKPQDAPGMNEIGSLLFSSIDPESLSRLLTDLEDTKRSLGELNEQLRALGIPNL